MRRVCSKYEKLPAWDIGPVVYSNMTMTDKFLSEGEMVVVVDNYDLVDDRGKTFMATVFVCRYGLKDCRTDEMFSRSEIIPISIG